MAVGRLIEGVVAADAKEKGAMAIPTRSAVRGRVRRYGALLRPISYSIVRLECLEA
jgi:hypothetical protein